jgi:group I intron endonuclease
MKEIAVAEAIVSCIYTITNTVNGKKYVGSAVNFATRLRNHKSQLSRGKHHSAKLQRSYDKHGAENFSFDIVEIVSDVNDLVAREQDWIDRINPWFNIAPKAGSQLGFKHSSESIEKMSKSQKSKPLPSKETCELISKNHRRHQTEETKKKIGDIHRGRTGHVKSEETRLKLSDALKGKKKPPRSAEHCRKISDANKGRKRTEDVIRRSAAGNIGKTRTEETRRKLSEKALTRDPECYARAAATRAITSPKKGIPWTEARREAQNKKQAIK